MTQILKRNPKLKWLAPVAVALAARVFYLAYFNTDYVSASVYLNSMPAHNYINTGEFVFDGDHILHFFGGPASEPWKKIKHRGVLLDPHEMPPEPYAHSPIARPPGMSIMLAALGKLTGSIRLALFRYFQIIIDALFCLLIGWFAGKVWSEKIGYIVSFAYALYLPVVWLAAVPMEYVWLTWFGVGSAAVIIKGELDPYRFMAVTAIAGIGYWLRNELILFPYIFLALLLLFKAISFRRMMTCALAGLIPIIIMVFGYGLFFKAHTGNWYFSRNDKWHTLVQGRLAAQGMCDYDVYEANTQMGGKRHPFFSQEYHDMARGIFFERFNKFSYWVNPKTAIKALSWTIGKPNVWGPEILLPDPFKPLDMGHMLMWKWDDWILFAFRGGRRVLMVAVFVLALFEMRRLYGKSRFSVLSIFIALFLFGFPAYLTQHQGPAPYYFYSFRWCFYICAIAYALRFLRPSFFRAQKRASA
ncbi:hypothetical protein ACFL6Y_08725 [Elusimicrobiota bacterium]